MRLFLLIIIALLPGFSSLAQQTIPLYSNNIPNTRNVADEEYADSAHAVVFKVSKPDLTIYLPPKKKANGTAVIICPGGGYTALVIQREGFSVAKHFMKMGVAAFVLKYRLPSDRTMKDKSIGPLQDAQQAIKVLRERADEWHINPDKVGIMGFSAGGHVASTAGTHFNHAVINNKDNINLRPDFMILIYPVISMTDNIGHRGSRNRLLGKNPSPEEIKKFSNELNVTPNTPPAFIAQASDDSIVPVANSTSFYNALSRNKIPAALHIYAKGGHGFLKNPPRELWLADLFYWMKSNGWLTAPSVLVGEAEKKR